MKRILEATNSVPSLDGETQLPVSKLFHSEDNLIQGSNFA